MLPLQVLIKATGACNLRCTYCNDWRAESIVLDESLLDELFARAIGATLYDHPAFIWHGGEPMTLPVGYYARAVELQHRHGADRRRVVNAIQTNGTLISSAWIKFLKEHRFAVSVSMDGPENIHGITRPNVGGHSSYPMVHRGIQRLQDAGIPFGSLFVVTDQMRRAGAEAIWEFILQLGLTDADFIAARPPIEGTRGRQSPTVDPQFTRMADWCDFMRDLFDLWWSSDARVSIRTFESIMSRIIGATPEVCLLSGSCLGSVFAIEPDGTVTACDVFAGSQGFDYGNIRDLDFDTILKTDRMRCIRTWNEHRLRGLRSCEFFEDCQGGCPENNLVYMDRGSLPEIGRCCGWAPLVRHIRDATTEQMLAARESIRPTAGKG